MKERKNNADPNKYIIPHTSGGHFIPIRGAELKEGGTTLT